MAINLKIVMNRANKTTGLNHLVKGKKFFKSSFFPYKVNKRFSLWYATFGFPYCNEKRSLFSDGVRRRVMPIRQLIDH